jgi:hypothetical protein
LGCVANLNRYGPKLLALAKESALYEAAQTDRSGRHTSPERLFQLLRTARNQAMHQGAYARLVARHAVDFCLLLEDALVNGSDVIDDFIVRDPITAEVWQPLGLVRNTMLQNSFSWLPIRASGEWGLIGDGAIARILRGVENNAERQTRVTWTVEHAMQCGYLVTEEAVVVSPNTPLKRIFERDSWRVALVVDEQKRLIGLATPFDLL